MLVGMMIMKNEADRYLRESLEALSAVCEAVFVADDRSTDDSVDIALEYATVWSPPDSVPTFVEDEASFREAAWIAMTETYEMKTGEDWVLSVDADEIVAFSKEDFNNFVSSEPDGDIFKLKIHEVFGYNGEPLERLDGFWGDICNERLLRFDESFYFLKNKKMGDGSLPMGGNPVINQASGLHLLHLGYLRSEDRIAKYNRYSAIKNNGHSSLHVTSIIRRPTLREIPCCRFDKDLSAV